PPTLARTMPLPEGHWQKPTNIEHYKIFTTHAEALAWFETWKVSELGVLHGNNNDKVVPLDDPRYGTLESELAVVWKAYLELFPRDTEGLKTPPFIVLTNTPKVDAFALYDRQIGLSPHAFVVTVGALGSGETKADANALRGLIAHELAHYVLKHNWPG